MTRNRLDVAIAAVVIGFVLLALVITTDEILDLPHRIFGTPPTPLNWAEASMEVALVIIVGSLVVLYLARLSAKPTQVNEELEKYREHLEELVDERTAELQKEATERKQAEEALRESERKYRDLVENVSDVIYAVDQNGVATYVSPVVQSVLGYGPSELVGRSFADLMYWEDVPRATDGFLRTLSGNSTTGEYRMLTKSGEILWIRTANRPIFDADRVVGARGVVTDITERKQAEERLEHLNAVLRAIRSVNQLITEEKDRGRLIQGACERIVKTRSLYSAWLCLLDESANCMTIAEAGLGDDFEPLLALLKRGEFTDCARKALAQSDVVATQDLLLTCGDCPMAKTCSGRGAMTVRLEHGGKLYGVCCITIPAQLTADDEEQALFKEVAADIALALHTLEAEARARDLNTRLLQTYIHMTQCLAAALEAKDPYTRGHSARVSRIAVAIAKELGMSDQEIEGIRVAGIIHDIGKIGVPGEILNRPGKLTPQEFEIVKNHVQAGCAIIESVDFPWETKPMVAQHHERLDGTGYPAGLKGDEIVFTARIMAVADVFEAMTSHRPYRPALPVETAIDELTRGAGRLFDSTVVQALLSVLETQGEELTRPEAPPGTR